MSDELNQEVYILRIFKANNDDTRVQGTTLKLVNSILKAVQEKIGQGAGYIADGGKMKTVTLTHMRSSASTVLSGGDGEDTIEERTSLSANDAVEMYKAAQTSKEHPKPRSERAMILISVSRVERSLKIMYSEFLRIQETAAVYLAAILDDLCTIICLSAAQASEKRGAKTVQPLDVYHGILSVPTLHGILGFALQGPHVGAFAELYGEESQGGLRSQGSKRAFETNKGVNHHALILDPCFFICKLPARGYILRYWRLACIFFSCPHTSNPNHTCATMGKKPMAGRRKEEKKRDLEAKEPGQEYGKVVKMLGNGRLTAYCFDGVTRMCRIRGKMLKQVWVAVGDLVLVSLRDFQDAKGDVILKYSPEEVREMRARKWVPDTATSSAEHGEGPSDQAAFEFASFDSVDVADI
jgi:translation initiation factor 1A